MALWDEVKSRYSAAVLRGLTNPDTPSAVTVNDSVGSFAAADVQADFLLFATITYDPTNATHVALAVTGVFDKLEIRRGLLATEDANARQAAWETKLSTLSRLRGVSRVKPTGNSRRCHPVPRGSSTARRSSGTLVSLTLRDLEVTGTFLARRRVVAKTVDYTLASSDSGTLFTTTGATGKVTLELPPWELGLEYSFANDSNGHALEVLASGTDVIRAGGQVSTAGGNVQSSSKVGHVIKLVAHASGAWVAEAITGAWSVN